MIGRHFVLNLRRRDGMFSDATYSAEGMIKATGRSF